MHINMEEKQKKILIGVGAVTVVGAIIYFATKKPTTNTTTVVADTGLYRPPAPETNPIEQIISGILGLFKKKKEKTAASGNCPSGQVPCAVDKNKCYDPLANYKQDPCK
jgi:hypothetical protein